MNYISKFCSVELGNRLDGKTLFTTHDHQTKILTVWDIEDENKSLINIHNAEVLLNDLIKISGYWCSYISKKQFVKVEIYLSPK